MSGDGKLTEKIREALRASGASQVIAVHEGYGAEWAVQAHEDPLLDALAPLIAAEVRTAQADALRDAAQMIRDACDRWEVDGDDERLVNDVLDPWTTRALNPETEDQT